jgi:POT family proton-dependent oligopeptide transporter
MRENMSTEKKGLRGFPSTFWIANVMELFERGAYYGMNSVLAIYMTEKKANGGLGFAEDAVGFLQAIIYALVYIIPILGGALAEKFGYRRMLIAAFSILTFGYFATGNFSSYGLVFASLCIMATGAGLFKPIISGTIARTTTKENSGFGFGIYYWMINLGAFISPIIVSYLKGFSWKYVFMASSIWCFLMLIPAVFIYKDPKLPGKSLSLRQTSINTLTVLRDSRFMLMIFIYSFFWILYFQNFGTILWYLRDFVDKTPVNTFMTNFFSSIGLKINFVFGEEYVTTINAGIIILLQVIVSRIVKNRPAVPVMCSGMFIGSIGFIILALTTSPWFFILGIVVFSIGEMTAHPKYYSYVGIIAPEEKKAIYMGYAFLYGVIGSLFGSSFGAYLYTRLAKPGHTKTFFLLFAVLCIIGSVGLVLFHKFLAADTPENNRRAHKIVLSVYCALIVGGIVLIATHFPPAKQDYRLLANSIILLIVGATGLFIMLRKSAE